MALNIRPQTREALKPKLIEFLEGARVERGSVLNGVPSIHALTEAESLLPKSGPTRESLDVFVGENSLSEFVDDLVRTRLKNRTYDPDAAETSLPNALEGTDLGVFADEIVDALATLPWDYWASLWLPEKLSAFAALLPQTYPIGPFRFVQAETDLKWSVQNPIVNFGGLLGAELQFAPNRCALQVRTQGFVPKYGATGTVHDTHSFFKAFFGLGLALSLFKIDDTIPAPNTRLTIEFGQIDGDNVHRVSQKLLSHAESGTLQSISYDPGRAVGMELGMGGSAKMTSMAKIFDESERHWRASPSVPMAV